MNTKIYGFTNFVHRILKITAVCNFGTYGITIQSKSVCCNMDNRTFNSHIEGGIYKALIMIIKTSHFLCS